LDHLQDRPRLHSHWYVAEKLFDTFYWDLRSVACV
jgi:hypothetical protein